MLHTPILNPALNEMLGRVRHTNTLVICDKGFPSWPGLQTIDISLVDDSPSVLDVVHALMPHFTAGRVWMAEQFKAHNDAALLKAFETSLKNVPITFVDHDTLKKNVPAAIGVIRTGGTSPYSNIILESA